MHVCVAVCVWGGPAASGSSLTVGSAAQPRFCSASTTVGSWRLGARLGRPSVIGYEPGKLLTRPLVQQQQQ
jgi:hypothetical protein